MITFDPDVFRVRFPAFTDETKFPSDLLRGFYDTATCIVSDNDYGRLQGKCRETALYYMVAHMLTINQIQFGVEMGAETSGGIVTSSTVGSITNSIAAPPFGSDNWSYWMNLSEYGQFVLGLLSAASVGGFYVGGSDTLSAFRGPRGF